MERGEEEGRQRAGEDRAESERQREGAQRREEAQRGAKPAVWRGPRSPYMMRGRWGDC